MAFVIKLQFQNDIRRVTVEKVPSFTELTELAKTLFENSLPSTFIVKYKDDEGDSISVGSDRELTEAFRVLGQQGVIRFTLAASEKKNASPSSPNTPRNPSERVIEFDVPDNLGYIIQSLIQLFQEGQGRYESCHSQNQQASDVHFGVYCDGCGASPIQGIRWKCAVCPDYDLCEKCNKQGIHKEHNFNKIDQPINYRSQCPARGQWGRCPATPSNVNNNSTSTNAPSTNEVVHFAICDHCNSRIRGIRHKCSVCPDYDLCDACEKLGVHPKEHSFSKITQVVGSAPRRCSFQRKPEEPKQEEKPAATQEIKKEEPKEEPKIIPLTPLRIPEPIKVEVKVEPKMEAPKIETKQEVPEEKSHPFADKLKQLSEMGFVDRNKNIGLLVKHNGDMIKAVMDLLV